MKAAWLAAVVASIAAIAVQPHAHALECLGGSGGGGPGGVITDAPFYNPSGEQCFPEGPGPGDCNGNGIPDRYDNQPCSPGTTPEGPDVGCVVAPCMEGCPAYGTAPCNEDDEGDEDSPGGDPLANYVCKDDDDDGHCNECDADKPRKGEDGESEYCEDEDDNGECDDCVQECWPRVIETLWWAIRFQNVTARCDVIVITLDPELGDIGEAVWGFPAISFAFDTCWTQSHFVNNARIAFRGAMAWIVSVYFWLLWFRYFWGL